MKKLVTIAALVSFMLGSLGTAFAEGVKAPESTATTEITTAAAVTAPVYGEPAVESDEPTVAEAAYGKAFFGTVKKILPAQKTFVVVHKKNKKIGKFSVDKNTKFFLRGRQVGPAALRIGDRVVVFVKAGNPNKAVRVRIVGGKALGKNKAEKLQAKVKQQAKGKLQEKVKQQVKQKLQEKVKQEAKDKVQGKVQQVKDRVQEKAKERVKERVQEKLKERVNGKGRKGPGRE